ncbi:DNA-directed RNA polymerase III subunit RPC4 [Cocos nucifera]|uniref:DNA-directed RNA polymerase III subunit RPC4 n=1 Tax=Cocos nucifera TaxID=13894 RepID=A0A8K0I654_COCNU|nr:DNA-directed RNA polymerase III subunit RPC4 [Cocos nucifera]
MKNKSSDAPSIPVRKMKFVPKIPPRKPPKPAVVKTEPPETKDEVIDKELLAKLNRAKDYSHSYYPVTLPLRRPYSGNPEILDEKEFGEASASSSLDEAQINPAEELGLVVCISESDNIYYIGCLHFFTLEQWQKKREEPQMLFFQMPSTLPMVKKPAAEADAKDNIRQIARAMKGCKLEELPAGYMGKLMVYKSGKIKMKIGDALFDVSPGVKCVFAQDVAAINTKEKHCCILGEIDQRAVVTPDVDALLDQIDDVGSS